MNQYDHIREQTVCPNCREEKSTGLILCWSCDYKQKFHNDGMYSKRLTAKLDAMEQALEDASR